MNVLKTIFTRSFVFWLGLVAIYACVQIFRAMDPLLAWVGLELTALPLIPFFINHMRNDSPTKQGGPSANRAQILTYTLISGLGLAICMAVSFRYHQAAGIIHIWAGATFIAWVIFVRFCLRR